MLASEVTDDVEIEIDDDGDLYIEQATQTLMIGRVDIDDFVQELRNLVELKRKRKPESDEA